MTAFEANAWEVASHLVNLSVAFALAIPIGWDRERDARSAGIRTFPLVSIAACGFVLVAIRVLGADSAGQARIIEGLATGVGFIGGGAILKRAGHASGTATAASLWATGAVGAAVGYGLYDIGAILSVVTFLSLRRLAPLKRAARRHDGDGPSVVAPGAGRAGASLARPTSSDELVEEQKQ